MSISTPTSLDGNRVRARIAPLVAGSFVLAAVAAAPAAWAQPDRALAVEATCLAQTTTTPDLLGGGATAQDSITCTDANGQLLVSGRSELTIDGPSCGQSTATVTTSWDDGTRTVTETAGGVAAGDRIYVATGQVTADSTKFAGAVVTITGTGVEPGCDTPWLPTVAVYNVVFHR